MRPPIQRPHSVPGQGRAILRAGGEPYVVGRSAADLWGSRALAPRTQRRGFHSVQSRFATADRLISSPRAPSTFNIFDSRVTWQWLAAEQGDRLAHRRARAGAARGPADSRCALPPRAGRRRVGLARRPRRRVARSPAPARTRSAGRGSRRAVARRSRPRAGVVPSSRGREHLAAGASRVEETAGTSGRGRKMTSRSGKRYGENSIRTARSPPS